MSKSQGHVRNEIGCVRPYIYGPLQLPEFVQRTFNSKELERNEFGPESVQVEMQIGDSVIVIEAGELPPDVAPWTNSIYVYVEDVDVVYARALELGAEPVASPENKPYHERQACFMDSGGNTWWISTYKS